MARNLKLPHNWNQITIEQFQAVHKLTKKDPGEANMLTLAILSGKSMDYIEEFSKGEIKAFIKQLAWMERLPAGEHSIPFTRGNHVYYFVLSPDEMNGGDYTDISHFSGDAVENLHNICAKLTTHYTIIPKRKVVKDFHQRAETFRTKMPFGMAYSYMLFFSACYPKLQEVTQSFFQGIEQAANLTR